MARNRQLLVPGIETVGLHADRYIEVKSDLHAEFFSVALAIPELPISRPLDEFDELDLGFVLALTQPGAFGFIGLPPFFRPFPPRPFEFVPQHFKRGEAH